MPTMSKKLCVLLIVMCLLLSGCDNKQEENKDSNIENNQTNQQENVKQFYDSSRLDSSITYNYDIAVKNFSFRITEYEEVQDDQFNYSNPIEVIYSYVGNDNVKFLSSSNISSLSFNYYFGENDAEYVNVRKGDYTKDNYKQKIKEHNTSADYDWDEDYEIIQENGEYVIFKKYNKSNDTIYYYGLKFFNNGKSIMGEISDYSNPRKEQTRFITALTGVLSTIVPDNGDAILEDKIASITNFQNKKLVSYSYLLDIRLSYYNLMNSEGISLNISKSNHSSSWKVLSSGDPYITINDEKVYKVVKNGIPEFYQFKNCGGENGCQNLGGTLDELESLLKKFYK